MKIKPPIVLLAAMAIVVATFVASPLSAQETSAKPVGKLVLFADLAVFQPGPRTEVCTVRNRFKKGESVGFRLYAVDGGSNSPEESAKVVVHISLGGKNFDLPALYRGVSHDSDRGGSMPIRPGMWTAKWKVPDDAPTGIVHYTATASDKYGRTADWSPRGGEPSFLTIVE